MSTFFRTTDSDTLFVVSVVSNRRVNLGFRFYFFQFYWYITDILYTFKVYNTMWYTTYSLSPLDDETQQMIQRWDRFSSIFQNASLKKQLREYTPALSLLRKGLKAPESGKKGWRDSFFTSFKSSSMSQSPFYQINDSSIFPSHLMVWQDILTVVLIYTALMTSDI